MAFIFERVPEVVEVRSDLEEALGFHGLTRARMSAELIRWLDSVKLEDPETYRYLVSDPPQIAPLIERWDFVFSTGMTTDYPARREWTHWMALREFIQNALDVEERVYGYENMALQIFHDNLGVHIIDRGPGITLEAFKLGGSDKGCEERGFFGEGLKVAAAHYAGHNVLVYVLNRQGQVFKLCLSPGTNLVVVVLGRSNYPSAGTEVILHRATMAPELLQSTIFQEWLKVNSDVQVISKKTFGSPACEVAKPNFIVARKGQNVDILWVRDIFVNSLTNITRNPAIFGYNLWWVPLEPNRVMVADQSALAKFAAKTFNAETAKELLDRIVESGSVKKGFFETDTVDWWYTPEEVKDAAKEWVEDHGYGVTTNERAADWVMYMGVRPLIIPDNLSNFFERAPTAEEKVIKKSKERLKHADETAVPEEALPLNELINLGASKAILVWVQRDAFYGRKLPDIIVSESLDGASGSQKGNKLYIVRRVLDRFNKTFSTLYHEYCHYYGEQIYGRAADLSEAFQSALTDVSVFIARALGVTVVVDAYNRALHGAWKASPAVWKEGRYVLKGRFLDNILATIEKITHISPLWGERWEEVYKELNRLAPVLVLVDIPELERIRPIHFHISSESVEDIIPEGVPPSRELYLKGLEEIADKLEALTRRGLIFMYDPWTDSYEVFRRIGI